jgi:hypothetical protein
MKQYLELSNGFSAKNKSNDIVGKLYDLMNVLEKDNNKENKMVLVYVGTSKNHIFEHSPFSFLYGSS